MITKSFTLSGAAAAVTLFAAGPLAAHPGDHSGLDVSGFIAHFVQEPFHAGGLLLAIALGAFAVVKLRKARANRREK
ncbi:hypothetical protein [Denitrobaculum tricleocarpae]|uniref:VPEID-CTERM sorting domain-containing protein n=1 Tax=Denitrobaculum tricleocarpae TaxID=2591009 RepID=A0A545TF68_9PROT|nr:hypothetical protein [Denitrobaculum tricleocarpae]TQV75882.1 hypothetical protein FKG95_23545 [Denitrobaculum tricleocarpae]